MKEKQIYKFLNWDDETENFFLLIINRVISGKTSTSTIFD